MLTPRGSWFLCGAFAMAALGSVLNYASLAVPALTLLGWFLWEWGWFSVQSRYAVRRLRVHRRIAGLPAGAVRSLWVGQVCEVSVRLCMEEGRGLNHVSTADWIPFAGEWVDGRSAGDGPVRPGYPLEFQYRIRAPHVGRMRFEGVRVRLADLQGFFNHEAFVPDVHQFKVLPALSDSEGHGTPKRQNVLPPPGVHRLRRSGSGSELLDLRDYLPGDPPKTIAWKVSARRDRLITKEFEGEVPIRTTLFLDLSQGGRIGPPGQTPLARLVEIAAAVSQASIACRDLTGLTLIDDHQAEEIRPARGPRHLAALLQRLTQVAGLTPANGRIPADGLLPLAYSFAEEVYPELLRPEVNHVPWWLAWFWVPPQDPREKPSRMRRIIGWLFMFQAFLPFVIVMIVAGMLLPPLPWAFFVLTSSIGYYLFIDYLRSLLPQFLSPRRRRQIRRRKRMAALLSVRYALGPGGVAALLEDEREFSLHLQRFLGEHQVPYRLPLYGPDGKYLFASANKIRVLAKSLARAVGLGRDNELFVLLVDLLEQSQELEPLFRAVRLAIGKHHQVLIVCPWPPDIPPPTSSSRHQPADAPRRRPRRRSGVAAKETDRETAERLTEELQVRRLHEAHDRLRRAFGRLGVPVVAAVETDTVTQILDRIERLRGVRRRA